MFHVFHVKSQSYIDLFSLRYQYSPNNDYKKQEGQVSTNEWKASFTYPKALKNGKDYLILGAAVNRLKLSQEYIEIGETELTSSEAKFQGTAIQLGFIKQWSDQLSTTFMLIPKLSSDMEEISREDFQLGGLLMFAKKKNEKFTLKYGLYYNQEYFSSFLAPLIGWDWKISDKLRFWALLPSYGTLEYQVGKRLRAGFKYESPMTSYRLSEGSSLFSSGYMHQTFYGKTDLYLDAYLTNSMVIQARIGHSVLRNYRVFAENDQQGFNIWGIGFQDRSEIQPAAFGAIKDGLLLEVGLHYRYNLEQEQK